MVPYMAPWVTLLPAVEHGHPDKADLENAALFAKDMWERSKKIYAGDKTRFLRSQQKKLPAVPRVLGLSLLVSLALPVRLVLLPVVLLMLPLVLQSCSWSCWRYLRAPWRSSWWRRRRPWRIRP